MPQYSAGRMGMFASLTHWGWNKMDDIFQTFPNAFSWIKMFQLRLEFYLSLLLRAQLPNIPDLVQIMAWPRPGDKPLPELMKFSWPAHIRVTWSKWVEHIREIHWLDFILISVLPSLHYHYLSWLLATGINRFLSLLNTTPSRLLNCISLYMEKKSLVYYVCSLLTNKIGAKMRLRARH